MIWFVKPQNSGQGPDLIVKQIALYTSWIPAPRNRQRLLQRPQASSSAPFLNLSSSSLRQEVVQLQVGEPQVIEQSDAETGADILRCLRGASWCSQETASPIAEPASPSAEPSLQYSESGELAWWHQPSNLIKGPDMASSPNIAHWHAALIL